MRLRGKIATAVTAAIVVVLGVLAAPKVLSQLKPAPAVVIPSVRVQRGSLENRIYVTGELRAAKTSILVAPVIAAGGTLQIIHIVKTGTLVNQGDMVAQFDPVEQEYNLEQNRSQLEEAEQQIKKMQADVAVRRAADNVALLSARFAVQRAELRVKGNDLLGAIEAQKNLISLAETRRRLEQMERDIKSKASTDQADLAVQNVNRMRATTQMKMAQQNIDNMTLRAPIGGVVLLGQNLSALASGGAIMISSSMEIPDYREGDQAMSGQTIAQIQDVAQMEIAGKIPEADRGNLNPGQAAEVYVDSLPESVFSAKIKTLAGMASTSFDTVSDRYTGTRSFDCVFELDVQGRRINPGVSARVIVYGADVKDALSLPRQALFTKEGKPVVYVKRPPDSWEVRPVQIKYLTESRAAIEGLEEGMEAALIDPTQQKAGSGGKAGVLASILGGAAR